MMRCACWLCVRSCILARRLSDAGRNVNVGPTQHRWQHLVMQHLVFGMRSSGRRFADVLLRVDAMARAIEPDGDERAPGMPVLPYRIAMVATEGKAAVDAEVARLDEKVDARLANYEAKLQRGKGEQRSPPKPLAAKQRPRAAKRQAEASASAADASGPAAGHAVSNRGVAKLLLGRVVRQLFPQCPVQPTVPYRGRIVAVLPASNAAQYRGQIWLGVEYEDGDEEQREVGELLRNAELVPFSAMSLGELQQTAAAALATELNTRSAQLDDVARDDAHALAALLARMFRPAGARSQEQGAGGGGGGGGEGGEPR